MTRTNRNIFITWCCTLMTALFLCNSAFADDNSYSSYSGRYQILEDIKGDFRNYYTSGNFKVMAGSFALGGILANTSADEWLQDEYQNNMRSESTDDFSKTAKKFGDGEYLIPLSLAAAAAGYFIPEDNLAYPIGTWGYNTARAYLVGAPPMLLMQVVTGASRPGESSHGSEWSLFNDNNGVSGHSFMGAVPFLTLAKMNRDNPVKWLFYGASFLTGWSRVNDDDHFVSQSVLGWVMAYQSVRSVFMTDKQRDSSLAFNLYPYGKSGAGFLLSYAW